VQTASGSRQGDQERHPIMNDVSRRGNWKTLSNISFQDDSSPDSDLSSIFSDSSPPGAYPDTDLVSLPSTEPDEADFETNLETPGAINHPDPPQHPIVFLRLSHWARLTMVGLALLVAIQYWIINARFGPFPIFSRAVVEILTIIVTMTFPCGLYFFALEVAWAIHVGVNEVERRLAA
jgi:hypothetical protein